MINDCQRQPQPFMGSQKGNISLVSPASQSCDLVLLCKSSAQQEKLPVYQAQSFAIAQPTLSDAWLPQAALTGMRRGGYIYYCPDHVPACADNISPVQTARANLMHRAEMSQGAHSAQSYTVHFSPYS